MAAGNCAEGGAIGCSNNKLAGKWVFFSSRFSAEKSQPLPVRRDTRGTHNARKKLSRQPSQYGHRIKLTFYSVRLELRKIEEIAVGRKRGDEVFKTSRRQELCTCECGYQF